MIRVTAPGKLMVAGEYAVLHGHGALVAAVDRRAILTLGGEEPASRPYPLPPEAIAAREFAEARLGAAPGALFLDVRALRSDGQVQKLGLGSSAAAAAAAAAAVFAAHGRDISDSAVRAEILADAMAGHRRVAPNGSGADVAAATLGGIVRFKRSGDSFEAEAATLPAEVEIRVVWTGAEARTSDLVAAVGAWAATDPTGHDEMIRRIADAAADFAQATEAGALVAAAAAHGEAMAELGDRAGAPIVEARLRAVMGTADRAGGAAKPSGAGGGDVAIAFFGAAEEATAFERACVEDGFALLPLRLGDSGVEVIETPEHR